MATWTLKQAKDHLSALLDRAIAGEPQEIVRRGDPPVMVVAKSAITGRHKRGSALAAITKHAELSFEIPTKRKSHRRVPTL